MGQSPLFSGTGNLGYAVRLVEKLDDCQQIRRYSLDIAITENILPKLPLYPPNERTSFLGIKHVRRINARNQYSELGVCLASAPRSNKVRLPSSVCICSNTSCFEVTNTAAMGKKERSPAYVLGVGLTKFIKPRGKGEQSFPSFILF